MEEIKPNTKNQDSKENSSIKRIGNFIRDARLSRNQTIEELASTLKIGSHQLQAIEDGILKICLKKFLSRQWFAGFQKN